LQSSGAQVTIPRSAQVPAPSQVLALADFFLSHEGPAQSVPAGQSRHAPAPSQAPSSLQPLAGLAPQRACGSALPLATAAHVPTKPGTLQAWQVGHEVDPQQTPSTQLWLAQSEALEQAAPTAFAPHTPPAPQVNGATQSALDTHRDRQPPARQTNGLQSSAATDRAQVPAPSHAAAPNAVLPRQRPAPQVVPASYSWQAPLPSHVPVRPQVVAAWATQPGSATSAATGWQVPARPLTLQAWHVAQLPPLQHTPSVQWPLAHWPSCAHAVPAGLRPQLPAVH
jgi:hypothetical protein